MFNVASAALASADVVINTLQIFLITHVRKENKITFEYADTVYKCIRPICIILYLLMIAVSAFVTKGNVPVKYLIVPVAIELICYMPSVWYIKYYSVFAVINDISKFMISGIIRLTGTLLVLLVSAVLKQYALYILCLHYTVCYTLSGFYIRWCINNRGRIIKNGKTKDGN